MWGSRAGIPGEDSMNIALAGGGIQITANIKTVKGAEDPIKLVETAKLLAASNR
jgi:hypothetical protein